GPRVIALALIGADFREANGNATAGGNARQPGLAVVEGRDDGAVVSPAGPEVERAAHVAQRYRHAALDGNLPELAPGGEGDPLTVGGKERGHAAVRAGNGNEPALVESSNREVPGAARRVVLGGDEACPVGRKSQLSTTEPVEDRSRRSF